MVPRGRVAGAWLAASGGALTAVIGLALLVAPTPVVGEVRASDGSPLAGATVMIGNQAGLTDGKGRYAIFAVSRRAQAMQVAASGFLAQTVPLKAGRGSLRRVVDVRMHRSPRLFGRVVDEFGHPLASAHVLLYAGSRWTPEQMPEAILTDDDGRFVLDDLPAESVLLEVTLPGYVGTVAELTLQPDTLHRTVEGLVRERGRLAVTTNPAGATVTVVGSPATCTSPCELVLESGDYRVRLSAPRYVPVDLAAHIAHERLTVLRPTLERMMGHLRVSAPAGATIFVNDAAVGAAPFEGDLAIDVYTVGARVPHAWPARVQTELKWHEVTTVDVPPARFGHHPDRDSWVAGMERYLAGLSGRYGVAALDLDGGSAFGTRLDESFTAASVIKIPIALYAYREVEAGRLKLDDTWEMLAEDVSGGTGILQSQAPGTRFTVRYLLEVLIRQSDNSAATMFRRILGSEKIDAYMAELGAPGTRQVSVTTPRETLSLLALLWRRQILTPEHQEELLAWLKTTAFNDWLPAGVPAGVPVAHKVGMYGTALNDVGIVYAGRPYVLAVFSDTGDWDTAARVLSLISTALYEFEE